MSLFRRKDVGEKVQGLDIAVKEACIGYSDAGDGLVSITYMFGSQSDPEVGFHLSTVSMCAHCGTAGKLDVDEMFARVAFFHEIINERCHFFLLA